MERYLFLIEGFGLSEEWKASFYNTSFQVTGDGVAKLTLQNEAGATFSRNSDTANVTAASAQTEFASAEIPTLVQTASTKKATRAHFSSSSSFTSSSF